MSDTSKRGAFSTAAQRDLEVARGTSGWFDVDAQRKRLEERLRSSVERSPGTRLTRLSAAPRRKVPLLTVALLLAGGTAMAFAGGAYVARDGEEHESDAEPHRRVIPPMRGPAPPAAVVSISAPSAVPSVPAASATTPRQSSSGSDPARVATRPKPGDEIAHLYRLRQIRGEPLRTLAQVEAGHRRFPNGTFWQEREALAVRALVAAGRHDDARIRMRAFVVRFPRSVHTRWMRRELTAAAPSTSSQRSSHPENERLK